MRPTTRSPWTPSTVEICLQFTVRQEKKRKTNLALYHTLNEWPNTADYRLSYIKEYGEKRSFGRTPTHESSGGSEELRK